MMRRWILTLFFSSILIGGSSALESLPIEIEGTRITIRIGDGWDVSERNAERTLAGFESSDERSSIFISEAAANRNMDMKQVMDSTIANFEKAFIIKSVGEVKTGPLTGGGIAAYCSIDLEMKTTGKPIPFRFYLYLIDTEEGMYLLQGSTMKPIRTVREKEIIDSIRSLRRTE